MSLATFLTDNLAVILFYAIIAFLIVKYRKKFEVQAKVIFLYKTKIGIKLMKKFSQPLSPKWDRFGRILFNISGIITTILLLVIIFFGVILKTSAPLILVIIFAITFLLFIISIVGLRQIKKAGVAGIYVGFIGMAGIVAMLIKGLFDLILRPEAPPALSPVIPGVKIPGSPIFVPFWYGIISLFLVIVIHEFAHGVVSKANKVKINSSGVGMMAIIPLAFVEPDEEALNKSGYKVKNSVFAAGPFSNILFAILALLIASFIISPAAFSMTDTVQGVYLFSQAGTPAAEAGMPGGDYHVLTLDVMNKVAVAPKQGSGVLITQVDGQPISNYSTFLEALNNTQIGDTVTFANSEKSFEVTAEDNEGEPRFGFFISYLQVKPGVNTPIFILVSVLMELFGWLYILSLGIGLANLLPLGPVDGGRMLLSSLKKWFDKKKAATIFTKITALFLTLIILLVFVPIIRAVIAG